MAEVITCPSGLTGRIRGMKVREERILAEVVRRLAARGGVLVTYTHYLPTDHLAPRPTLKLSIALQHTEAELAQLVSALAAVARDVPDLAAAEMPLAGGGGDDDDDADSEVAAGASI